MKNLQENITNQSGVNYNFYPTLLDLFQSYLDSDSVWAKYWGQSFTPKISREQFKQTQFQNLLNGINKVPGPVNLYADRGTVFNEIVDCLRGVGNPEKILFKKDSVKVSGELNGHVFEFLLKECEPIAYFYREALPQIKVSGTIETKYGNINLFGYIDELTSEKVYDIKTTTKYDPGKFCKNWQHKIYPFCLQKEGLDLKEFIYDVFVLNDNNKEGINRIGTRKFESYRIKNEEDLIRSHCEGLILFLKENNNLITNNKIFNR